MDYYIIGLNFISGIMIGILVVNNRVKKKPKNKKIDAILHILNFEYLKEERRDFYANRTLTLAGFSFTSLALYLTWNNSTEPTFSVLTQFFFLSTLLFLISSQITVEAERFWQLWISELVHYVGILSLLLGLRSFILEEFPNTNLIWITSLSFLLFLLYIYKLAKDLIEMINSNINQNDEDE